MVRKFLIAAAFCTLFILQTVSAQTFTVEIEPSGTKILKGFLERKDLQHDSLFLWFAANYQSYSLDSTTIRQMEPLIEDVHFFMVVGTWCGDSRREVPKWFKILDALQIPADKITVFGVDRSKQSTEGTTDKYNVRRVPTLIVFRGEDDIGRIVEAPRATHEIDLLRILKK